MPQQPMMMPQQPLIMQSAPVQFGQPPMIFGSAFPGNRPPPHPPATSARAPRCPEGKLTSVCCCCCRNGSGPRAHDNPGRACASQRAAHDAGTAHDAGELARAGARCGVPCGMRGSTVTVVASRAWGSAA
eukprot:2820736-Rhodomonas_salina.1